MWTIDFWKEWIFRPTFLAGLSGGVIALLGVGVFAFFRARKRKREERKAACRRVEFTLPESQNSYVRARLNTTLREEPISLESRGVELAYARELLSRLKGVPLATAERLELEEMGRALAVYGEKDVWSAYDLRAVNDCLGRLLRLSAKYTI